MRRDFLKLCGLAGLGVTAPVLSRAMAEGEKGEPEPYEGPLYAVFNASGGWDTTYIMDPKGVNGINRLYKEGDIQTKGQHKFAPIAKHIDPKSGMSNEDFFGRYGDELLVLNGLDYSVNNHSPCSRYTATGKLDSLAYPTFAALVAGCNGGECPLAFLTFGNYSATGNVAPMSRIPYQTTLKLIAKADSISGGPHPYHDDFVVDRVNQALRDQVESRKGKVRLPRKERAESMLYTAQVNSKALTRVVPFIADEVPESRLARQVEIALASFAAGVCVSANLNIGQFDSHANNDRDQMKLIPEFLAGVDYMVRRAEEMKIRDRLVIVIQSEMGRTPDYNKGEGKDHWSIGSIMFMGRGIKGNRVIGETDDGQFLKPISPKELKVDEKDGVRVRPEHIHQALRKLAGVADHPLSKKFPLPVKDGEALQGLWGV